MAIKFALLRSSLAEILSRPVALDLQSFGSSKKPITWFLGGAPSSGTPLNSEAPFPLHELRSRVFLDLYKSPTKPSIYLSGAASEQITSQKNPLFRIWIRIKSRSNLSRQDALPRPGIISLSLRASHSFHLNSSTLCMNRTEFFPLLWYFLFSDTKTHGLQNSSKQTNTP